MAKCEACGTIDLRAKFKKNKRFCSVACSKRWEFTNIYFNEYMIFFLFFAVGNINLKTRKNGTSPKVWRSMWSREPLVLKAVSVQMLSKTTHQKLTPLNGLWVFISFSLFPITFTEKCKTKKVLKSISYWLYIFNLILCKSIFCILKKWVSSYETL